MTEPEGIQQQPSAPAPTPSGIQPDPSLPFRIRRKEGLPFETTPTGVALVIVAFVASLGLFWAARESIMSVLMRGMALEYAQKPATYGDIGCFLAGGACLGGAIGSVVGHWFRDEKGGQWHLGAFIGTLVGPLVVVVLFFALLIAIWIWEGCPSA
jgi:hypothetical protein